jgi:seipin
MYNWRILSSVAFTSMFWGVSMVSTGVAWLVLSSYLNRDDTENEKPIKKEDFGEDDGHVESQEEIVDSFSGGELSDSQRIFPTLSRQMPLRYPGRVKSEDDDIFKQEEIEGSAAIAPGEADDEAEDVKGMPTDSGIGTSLDSGSTDSVQRRRSRLFDDHGHGAQEE